MVNAVSPARPPSCIDSTAAWARIKTTARYPSFGCLIWFGILPTAVCTDDRGSLARSPRVALVRADAVVRLKDGINHSPGGLNCVLTGEKRSVASHRVAQKPFVGHLFS